MLLCNADFYDYLERSVYIAGIAALALNGLVLAACLRHNAEQRLFKYFIGIHTIINMFYTIGRVAFKFVSFHRVLALAKLNIYIKTSSNGQKYVYYLTHAFYLAQASESTLKITFFIEIFAQYLYLAVFPTQSFCRYKILVSQSESVRFKTSIGILIGLFYSLWDSGSVVYLMELKNKKSDAELLEMKCDPNVLSNHLVYDRTAQYATIYANLHRSFIVMAFIIVVYYSVKTHAYVNKKSLMMSRKTVVMNRRLNHMILLQLSIPFILNVGPMLAFIFSRSVAGKTGETIALGRAFGLGILPLFDGFVIIFIFPSIRRHIMRIVCVSRDQRSSITMATSNIT
ncbi:unnamed protein product [Bursaphelenchus xylophilus]|uniref:(pine wood nematode) hypothetical protein n=1 Tax=Bursaphelenchus xylophilus TaxID=6326 RepID=A0A1I7S9B3_BURXY|nr:unnamed protein product [Bursaphelenchus xylophilus]CAG9100495.1 unnamed protein product [Bursaphelenchus xylophilus]